MEIYHPSKQTLAKANIKNYEEVYQKSIEDSEKFWQKIAEELDWSKRWKKVLKWHPPFAEWFVGGKCNIVYNALDRHIKTPKRNKVALYWEGQDKTNKVFTYFELYLQVNKFAQALRSLGVRKGNRVTIYLPRIPEQIISMLACAKIGAIHSVCYSGFSVEALRTRIKDARPKVIITADGAFYRDKIIPLKEMVDEALLKAKAKRVIVVRRVGNPIKMKKRRDIWWKDLFKNNNFSQEFISETMKSTDPLYLLYTSGTTGQPKGVLQTHGGYMVGIYITLKWIFDPNNDDIYWCTADPGWVTGHSYIAYAPFILGLTQVFYEGAPDWPDSGRWWEIIDKYKVTIFYTTPTAIRSLARFGEEIPNKFNLDSLKILGTVGEPIDPKAWQWFYKNIGHSNCPIMDTWWQTETGMQMISPFPSMPLKPGSAGKPFPGIITDIVNEKGETLPPEKLGYLIIRNPWPAMFKTLYKNNKRYKQTYWQKIPGVYFTGDLAKKDEDGYYFIQGRTDDVLKVSGYRFGAAEIESVVTSHPAVNEAAVIGKPHQIKGQSIKIFVILKKKYSPSDDLREEIKKVVRKNIGPIATPDEIEFVESLPKTRSGKIMRRVLKAKELDLPIGDISTLEE